MFRENGRQSNSPGKSHCFIFHSFRSSEKTFWHLLIVAGFPEDQSLRALILYSQLRNSGLIWVGGGGGGRPGMLRFLRLQGFLWFRSQGNQNFPEQTRKKKGEVRRGTGLGSFRMSGIARSPQGTHEPVHRLTCLSAVGRPLSTGYLGPLQVLLLLPCFRRTVMIYGIKKPPGAYKLSFHVASGNG